MKVEEASKYSIRNKDSIEKSEFCSCYYCFSTFKKDEIINWTDSKQTAICPKCSVDSVLGDSIISFSKDFFEKLHQYWF